MEKLSIIKDRCAFLVKEGKEAILSYIALIDKDPSGGIERSSELVLLHVYRQECAQTVLISLADALKKNESEEDRVQFLIDAYGKEVLSKARHPRQSTSPLSNFSYQLLTQAMIETLAILKGERI